MSVTLEPSPLSAPAPSDFAQTVARIRGGDERALERLLAAVAVPMRRMAEQYIGSPLRPHVDAEDLVQRVALILWHGLRGGKFEIAAPPQLLSLCRTLLKRQAAKAVQQNKPAMTAMSDTAEFAAGATLSDQPIMPAPCPAKQAEANEQIQRLMERVSEDDRRMLELLLLNHSIAATAQLLKIEPATLRKRLSRLRIRVRTVHHVRVTVQRKSRAEGPTSAT